MPHLYMIASCCSCPPALKQLTHTADELLTAHVLQRYAIAPAVHTAVQGPLPEAGCSCCSRDCRGGGWPAAAHSSPSHTCAQQQHTTGSSHCVM